MTDEITTPRLPTRPIWVDPKDDTVYIDIEFDAPLVRAPVQTPASPECDHPTTTIAVDEDEFLKVGA
ncbi:hypothetical protein Tco_1231568 [Tanacetum coccineum]